ncbi:MAG: putative ABC transporter ATP-binding protein YxlF [Firmicutes bacterium ADurb.Bin193]|nr:MAG: putative ABC transporter ATP-binding protein YxlF [Firmicutes bacterium ADurb.Bin193]
MITVSNLTKKYGAKKAVDNVSFTVKKGEILGFLGPNGAGKTTCMNIITGYISSTSGTVTVDGLDVLKNPEEVKRKIGYLPENPPLYMDMTVSEYLRFIYELKKIKLDYNTHVKEIMETVKITDVKNRLIKNLSKGYKQRVGLAQALMGNPEILILDEPTVGLDPKQINEIRGVIKDLGKERTIILSSHILPEVSAICERVVIINGGVIVASDTPENLSKGLAGKSGLTLQAEGEAEVAQGIIKDIDGVLSVSFKDIGEGVFEYYIETDGETDIRKDLFYAFSKNNMPILMLTPRGVTLEEVFLKLTASEKASKDEHSKQQSEVKNNDSDI